MATGISFEEPVDLLSFTNIAPVAIENGLVSAVFRTAHGYNRFVTKNEAIEFAVRTNLHADMVFDSDYVQKVFAAGRTTLKITFSISNTLTTWGKLYLGYYDASEAKFVKFDASAYHSNYIKTDQTYPETQQWEITQTMFNLLNFAEGDKLAICNLEPGEQTEIVMTITHLEFLNASAQA